MRRVLTGKGTFHFGLSASVLLLLAAGASTASRGSAADPLEQGFASPPHEAKSWVYWAWMNGNLSPEGITADLEALAEVGVGGVSILNCICGVPPAPEPVRFMTPHWRSVLAHAVKEAGRLGLEICLYNSDGWTAGGPWITPATSMQVLTSNELAVEGPQSFSDILPVPSHRMEYYAASGALQSWPQWLTKGTPRPTKRVTFATWKHWHKDDPLMPSGLLGPVTIRAAMKKTVAP